jgi:hypothetical protein
MAVNRLEPLAGAAFSTTPPRGPRSQGDPPQTPSRPRPRIERGLATVIRPTTYKASVLDLRTISTTRPTAGSGASPKRTTTSS